MIIQKITPGFVVQRFDSEKRRFISQEFVAGPDRDWEDQNGDNIENTDAGREAIYGKGGVDEPEMAFDMKQPGDNYDFKKGDKVLAVNDAGVEFQATVKGWRQGLYVTVEDQDGDCWDCDPADLESLEEKDRTQD